MGRVFATSLISLALPLFVVAQSRSGTGRTSTSGHAPVSTPRASPAPRAQSPAVNRSFAHVGSTSSRHRPGTPIRRPNGFTSGQIDFQDAPGLGFDFPHLAAISGNRRLRGSRFNAGFPFGFSGFLLSPPVIVEETNSPEPQPQEEEEAIAENTAIDPQRPSRSHQRAASAPESLAPVTPQPDAEQYVFVRRDGSLVFAVAYAWDNGSLRYVTPEGFRRTIASDALDLSATQQFNEQRGLTFRSPA